MKKAKTKGFTLVELLVVIAILAILATVSVVGYTSFIERATVSNDESIADQLNNYLTALRVDSSSEFYGESVTPENVWEMVNEALEENGTLTSLEPQSLKYGYNFFFKFEGDETNGYSGGEIVLAKAEDVINSQSLLEMISRGLSANAEEALKYEKQPGFFYDNEEERSLYFFLDTAGSDLATAVRGFYTTVDWESFKTAVGGSDYEELANKTIFVTGDGEYKTTSDGDKTNIIVHQGAIALRNDNGTDLSSVDNVRVPSSVRFITNEFLNGLKDGAKIIIDKTPTEVARMIQKSNTGALNGKKIYIGDTEAYITVHEDGESSYKNVVVDKNGNIIDCSYYNPVKEIKGIKVVEVKDKTKNLTAGAYIAWDYALQNDISFIIEAEGEDPTIPASYDNVTFKLGEADFNGRFSSNTDQTVTATVNGKTKEINVKFVYVTGATIKINGNSGTSFELENDDQNGGNTDFVVTLDNLNQNTNVEGITLDTSFVLSTASDKLVFDGTKITLASGVKDLYDDTRVIAKVGGYCDISFDVKVYSKSNLTFVATALAKQIKYIGDDNAITIGDLFALNEGMTLPTNAELWFGSDWADDSTMPGAVEKKVTDPTKHLLVDETTNTSITSARFTSNTLRFKDGAGNPDASNHKTVACYIVIPTGDSTTHRRISPVVTLKVVNAYNLKQDNIANFGFTKDNTELTVYDDLHYEGIANRGHRCAPISDTTTSKSIVLLEDVTWTANSKYYITFADNLGIYGNCFKFDVSGGRTNTISIIKLGENGWLRDVAIIGPQYNEEKDPWSKAKKYACSTCADTAGTVAIGGNDVTIDNCYISGGRAPVRIHGGKSLISNTVLFGGAFSNIDNQGVTFSLENVITINQYHSVHNSKIGGGIVISGDENAIKNTVIQIKGTFEQYNFVAKDETSYFANSSLESGIGAFFTESATKDRFVFTDSTNNKQYGHAGIIYDKNANSSLNDGSGNVDINIKVWDENTKSYVKKLPAEYGSAAINKTLLGMGVKITAAAFDKNAVGSGFNVLDYTTKTEFYAPSLINTVDHYQLTWRSTDN